jgi:hypothetical protein
MSRRSTLCLLDKLIVPPSSENTAYPLIVKLLPACFNF